MSERGKVVWILRATRTRPRRDGRARRARARRADGRGVVRLPRIAGGSGLSPEALRKSVRERLVDGRLPLASSLSVARRGTGRTCDVCGAPITRETVEREVEHAGETHGFAHEECYRIWREESRRADSPDPTR